MKKHINRMYFATTLFIAVALVHSCTKENEETGKQNSSFIKGGAKSSQALDFNAVVEDLGRNGAVEVSFEPIANNPKNADILKACVNGKYFIGKDKEHYVVLGYKPGESAPYHALNVYDEKGQIINAKVIICEVNFPTQRLIFKDVCESLLETGAVKLPTEELNELEWEGKTTVKNYKEMQLFQTGKDELTLVVGYKPNSEEYLKGLVDCKQHYSEKIVDNRKEVRCEDKGNTCQTVFANNTVGKFRMVIVKCECEK